MMRYNRLLSALACLSLLLAVVAAGAQANGDKVKNEKPVKLPFESAEELVYEGELTKAILRGLDVADLRFRIDSLTNERGAKAKDGRAQGVMQLTAEAESKGILSKLFGLHFRQRVESKVELSSFSVLQTTKLDEQGKRRRTSEAVFDNSAGKVVWTERDPNDPQREPRIITSDFNGAVHDIASVFYFLRTQPLIPGKSFELTISDSGRVYRIPVRVIERRTMKTVIGRVATVKVEPELFGEGRMIHSDGKISIWFTDDARHIPVKAQVKTDLGRLDIKLKSMKSGAY